MLLRTEKPYKTTNGGKNITVGILFIWTRNNGHAICSTKFSIELRTTRCETDVSCIVTKWLNATKPADYLLI